jgi:rubrerythrin
MEQQDIATGTKDATYDIVSVLYHALQGAENYGVYAKDAERSGDQELARFFQDLKSEESRRAERAKQLLSKRLMQGSGSNR